MEIRVLRYFLTVVREESITKASEVLHITQTTNLKQAVIADGRRFSKCFLSMGKT